VSGSAEEALRSLGTCRQRRRDTTFAQPPVDVSCRPGHAASDRQPLPKPPGYAAGIGSQVRHLHGVGRARRPRTEGPPEAAFAPEAGAAFPAQAPTLSNEGVLDGALAGWSSNQSTGTASCFVSPAREGKQQFTGYSGFAAIALALGLAKVACVHVASNLPPSAKPQAAVSRFARKHLVEADLPLARCRR